MAFGLAKTRISPIAIDFGADSVKLLQVQLGDPPQLITAASAELSQQARRDLAGRYAFLPEAIGKLLAKYPFKGKRAVCSIPAFQTLIQNLQVSGSEQSDLQGQVEYQLRERLDVDAARMVVRCLPVDQGGGKAGKLEVVCMAAGRDLVMRYIDAARQAKLDVVGMHCEPLAIMQAFSHLYRRSSDAQRTTVFMDIGAATTKIMIAHGAAIVFAKAIHAAGDHFTRFFADKQGIDFTEARQARFEHANTANRPAREAGPSIANHDGGVEDAGDRRSTQADGFTLLDSQLTATATETEQQTEQTATADPQFNEDTLDCLIDELLLCMRYYQSLFPDRTVEKLVFLGGESRHVELCQKIARAMRIGAQLGDPLARLVRSDGKTHGLDLRRPQPGWAVPMGLCLSPTDQ